MTMCWRQRTPFTLSIERKCNNSIWAYLPFNCRGTCPRTRFLRPQSSYLNWQLGAIWFLESTNIMPMMARVPPYRTQTIHCNAINSVGTEILSRSMKDVRELEKKYYMLKRNVYRNLGFEACVRLIKSHSSTTIHDLKSKLLFILHNQQVLTRWPVCPVFPALCVIQELRSMWSVNVTNSETSSVLY